MSARRSSDRSADPTATAAKATLRGMTWNHTRGYLPVVGAGQRFEELNPHVRVTWDKRSLQEFADAPLDELAKQYDLLVIDHPWAGFAAKSGVLVAMDDLLDAAFVADHARNSVGVSHASYRYDEKSWALALDAATPVASWRPDLLKATGTGVPTTWNHVSALAKQGKVAAPGIAQDTFMNFYAVALSLGDTLFANEEEVCDEALGVRTLDTLREFASLLPKAHFDWNPIAVYEQMTRTDTYAYCPWAYGYSNYSRRGYANHVLHFGDVVSLNDRPLRTTLGGTGLAVSAFCENKDLAEAFVRLTMSPEYQITQHTENGGQPGHRAAWEDEENNRRTHDYFKNTLPCLDRAYLRPTYPGALPFQDRDGGGAVVRDYLMNGGDPKAVMAKINQMYRDSIAAGKSVNAG